MDTNGEGAGIVSAGGHHNGNEGGLRSRNSVPLFLFKPYCPCLRKPIKLKRKAHPYFFSTSLCVDPFPSIIESALNINRMINYIRTVGSSRI